MRAGDDPPVDDTLGGHRSTSVCFAGRTRQPHPRGSLPPTHGRTRPCDLGAQTRGGSLSCALSDLVPRYLPERASLRCPADHSENGEPGYNGHADPRGGVSYSYELSGAPSGGMAIPPGPPPESDIPGKPWGTERNIRLWLRRFYGDRPPIVRCLHHSDKEGPVALDLTLAGEVYQGLTEWEHDPETAAEFARWAAHDLTTDRRAFSKDWKLSGISATIDGWGHTGRTEIAIGPINNLANALIQNADSLADPADADRVAGRLFLHVRDYESAERAAPSLCARRGHADEEIARQLLAESLAGRGLFRDAAALFRAMLTKNPDSKNIKANLADALEASGQAAEARAHRFDRSREKARRPPGARVSPSLAIRPRDLGCRCSQGQESPVNQFLVSPLRPVPARSFPRFKSSTTS